MAGRWKRKNFHFLDETANYGEAMANMFINQDLPLKVEHYLMHIDCNMLIVLWIKSRRLNTRANFAPLLCPIGANLFRTTDKSAFERAWPCHVRSHQGEG